MEYDCIQFWALFVALNLMQMFWEIDIYIEICIIPRDQVF